MQLSLDRIQQQQVDAFVLQFKHFSGNPAAVVMLPISMLTPNDEWHAHVAEANALSETAFVQRRKEHEQPKDYNGNCVAAVHYNLRWFTPTIEVDLCGHATLATAYALWKTNRATLDYTGEATTAVTSLHFHTRRSGILIATKNGDEITMDFPSDPTIDLANTETMKLLLPIISTGLTLKPPLSSASTTSTTTATTATTATTTNSTNSTNSITADVVAVHKGKFDLLVEVTVAAFARLSPNMEMLRTIPARGLIVTCQGDGKNDHVDFQSRWFGPQSGVPEDPVTGSAHCTLSCYWSQKLGKMSMVGHQASSRSGRIQVVLNKDKSRVSLTGLGRIFSTGRLEHCW